MSEQSVARQYAKALFQVAARAQRVEPIGRDLSDFARLVEEHEDLRAAFETPLVAPGRKRAVVDALVATAPGFSPEVARLLQLMADRNRLALVPEVARAYTARAMAADRLVEAEVVTAVPLDEDRKAGLARALATATGQRVTIADRVDPSIVGGVVAKVGSLVFDGSVVRQIERMRQQLLAEA